MAMEFEGFIRHILRPTSSTDMVQYVLRWERQKRYSNRKMQRPAAKKCCNNKILLNSCWGREDEDKRRQENDQT